MSPEPIYELADGDITVWVEESGAVMLKVREPFGDPVELGDGCQATGRLILCRRALFLLEYGVLNQ